MLKSLCVLVFVCLLYSEPTAGKKKKLCCNGPHESYNEKKPSCPPDFCVSLVARYDCTNTTVWPPPGPGCACDDGYLRPKEGANCVKICDCPQMKNHPDCKPKCNYDDDSDEDSDECDDRI